MKFVVFVPVTRNDGSEVSEEEMRGIWKMFWDSFDGLTIDGKTRGFWKDSSGRLYEDECLKLMVTGKPEQAEMFKTIVKAIGKQLGQLAMFTEISKPEIEIIDIE
jgi:hypothetical protein